MFGNTAFNQPNQGAGLFGQQAGIQSKPAGLFGAQTQTQGAGLFGATQQQPNAGLFGAPQTNNAFMGNTNAGGLFGGQAGQPSNGFNAQTQNTNQGAGIFGAPQQAGMGGAGLFGQQAPQQPTQGGLFGGTQPAQTMGGAGLFGAPQQSNPVGGIFGGQQQTQNTGMFGGQQQQTAGLFGAGQQQQPAGGLFGNPQSQTQPQNGGIFGGGGQQTQPQGGLFGAASTNVNQAFLGGQQQQSPFGTNTQTPNLFGAQQPNNQNGIFGQPQQQTNPPNAGGLFNTFAPQQGQNPLFGGQQQQQQQQQQQNSGFGQNNNKLGGTSWGVPTTLTSTPSGVNPINLGGQPQGALQPVRSKNSKLDQKHLIKCIAALDQFNGMSKEQIRMNFIQSGGQQPVLNQALTTGANSAFKPTGTPAFGAGQTSLPSFGGFSNNNLGTTGNLGQQAPGLMANPSFGGAQQPAKPSLFGNAATTTFGAPSTGSLFGQQPAQPQGSLFGQQPQQTAFGAPQPTLFGAQPAQPQQAGFGGFGQQQQPQTSLFGAPAQQQGLFPALGQTQQPTQSLFGQQQPQNQSLFGQTAAPLFGNQPAANGTPSLFGAQTTTPSLFGGQQQQQTTTLFGNTAPTAQPSLFGGQTPSLFGAPTAQTPSLFGTPQAPQPSLFGNQPTAQPSLFGAQPASTFAGLSSPMLQAPMDPNMQLLLPQMLLNAALNGQQSTQQYPNSQQSVIQGGDNNRALIQVISKLITTMSQNNRNNPPKLTSQNLFGAPSALDQLMSSVKNQNYDLRRNSSENRESLFSGHPREEDIYQVPPSYNPIQDIKIQDTYRYKQSGKSKKIDPLFTQENVKVVGQKYKVYAEQKMAKAMVHPDDLPKLGSYSITPPFQRLKMMSVSELKKVRNVRIFNKYGQIQFLEPVNVYRIDLQQSVVIGQDNIEVIQQDLQQKNMRLTFRNFGLYRTLKTQDRQKMIKKMKKWIGNNGMQLITHDLISGDLVVEVRE